jgi:hypothetical protein
VSPIDDRKFGTDNDLLLRCKATKANLPPLRSASARIGFTTGTIAFPGNWLVAAASALVVSGGNVVMDRAAATSFDAAR